jgi:hypothetical protein
VAGEESFFLISSRFGYLTEEETLLMGDALEQFRELHLLLPRKSSQKRLLMFLNDP